MSAIGARDDDRVFVRSLPSVASSLVMIGKTEDALSLTEAGLACALRVREELPRAPGWAVSSRCTALAFAGRVPEALELLDFSLSSSGHPADQRAMSNVYRARFLLFEGRVASAVRSLKDASLGVRTEPGYGSWCLALLAEGEALLGHPDAAAAARRESLSRRANERLSVFVDGRRALAWVDAQEGRLTDAMRSFGRRRTWHASEVSAPSNCSSSMTCCAWETLLPRPEHRRSLKSSKAHWERRSDSTPWPWSQEVERTWNEPPPRSLR